MTSRTVLAFSENADVAGELLAVARPLADAAAAQLVALVVAAGARARAEEAIARGADEALLADPREATRPDADACLEALHAAVVQRSPSIVLLGSTRTGLEVAGRLAQRLGVACVSDALTLELEADGSLLATRRTFGGRFVARVRVGSTPAIATVPPNRFEAPPRDAERRGRITELMLLLPEPRLRTVAREERPRGETDLRKASVIVAVGRGMKRREDLALADTLCRELRGALAGSRPITDERGWLPPNDKIGISGHTVRPSLYVACGISGQIEHVVGMRAARTVVAINTDPTAPIHAEADYSIVADLYAVLPALAAALREARGRPTAATDTSAA